MKKQFIDNFKSSANLFLGVAMIFAISGCKIEATAGNCLSSENLPYQAIEMQIIQSTPDFCYVQFINDWDLGEAKMHGKGELYTFHSACVDVRKMSDGTNPTTVVKCRN